MDCNGRTWQFKEPGIFLSLGLSQGKHWVVLIRKLCLLFSTTLQSLQLLHPPPLVSFEHFHSMPGVLQLPGSILLGSQGAGEDTQSPSPADCSVIILWWWRRKMSEMTTIVNWHTWPIRPLWRRKPRDSPMAYFPNSSLMVIMMTIAMMLMILVFGGDADDADGDWE